MMYGQWKRGIKFYEINKEENHNTHIKARTRYTNMLLVLSLDYFLYSSAMNTYFENFLNIIYENISWLKMCSTSSLNIYYAHP